MEQSKNLQSSVDDRRRLERVKAVLPVRVSGNNDSADGFSDLVHTLDISSSGARLGAVRRQFEVGTQIVLQYRQHKAEFRVVWIRPLGAGGELQVGLEADVQRRDLWGLQTSSQCRPCSTVAATSPASVGA